MTDNTEREAFEKVCPVPEGLHWSTVGLDYAVDHDLINYGLQHEYRSKWQGRVSITRSASTAGRGFCYFNGAANVEHPNFGLVTVRLETVSPVDSRGSVEKREADFRTFIERCVKSIEESAREG